MIELLGISIIGLGVSILVLIAIEAIFRRIILMRVKSASYQRRVFTISSKKGELDLFKKIFLNFYYKNNKQVSKPIKIQIDTKDTILVRLPSKLTAEEMLLFLAELDKELIHHWKYHGYK